MINVIINLSFLILLSLVSACGTDDVPGQVHMDRETFEHLLKQNKNPQPDPSNHPNPIQSSGLGGFQNLFKDNSDFFTVLESSDLKQTFDGVAGLEEAKQSLKPIISYLKNPQNFTRLGAEPPSGVIFYGPPGTGKTEIARALAGEVNKTRKINFIVASGASFEDKYVGGSAEKVRRLFEVARKNKPVIIFIDEFDTLARKRSKEAKNSGMVNELLTQLDGFSKEDRKDIFIVAATNHLDKLDPAVIRAGRIDRKVEIGLPDPAARKAVIEHYLEKAPKIQNIYVNNLVTSTKNWSSADLKALVNEARINATERGAAKVEQEDFATALKIMNKSRKDIGGLN
jgi:cell division protease FtsH